MKRTIARIICILTALACFGYIGWYYYQMNRTQEDVEALAGQKEMAAQEQNAETTQPVSSVSNDEGKTYTVLDSFKPLLAKNRNIIGWITIADTNIDYPVMKSLAGNGDYYLNHNFDQEEDRNGALFMDDRCDVTKPTANWIIYGHHMKSGKMFGDLVKYKDESFFEKHRAIEFDTIYEMCDFEVMAVFESKVYTDTDLGFRYYDFIDPASELDFMTGVTNMKSLSLYDTGVTAEYGDQLLTLSTCDYEQDNGRFVVVLKKIDS